MNIIRPVVLASSLIAALSFSSTAAATTFDCPDSSDGFGRQISVSPNDGSTAAIADACAYGLGNGQESDVETAFGADFTKVGEVTASGESTNSLLHIALDSGSSWGSAPASGAFTIDSSFWNTYATAVLTFHVGNAPDETASNPDWFAFQLVDGVITGDWDYTVVAENKGGGLSNAFLWGADTSTPKPPVAVTEPAQLGILMLGVFGLIAARRRQH